MCKQITVRLPEPGPGMEQASEEETDLRSSGVGSSPLGERIRQAKETARAKGQRHERVCLLQAAGVWGLILLCTEQLWAIVHTELLNIGKLKGNKLKAIRFFC